MLAILAVMLAARGVREWQAVYNVSIARNNTQFNV